MTLPAGAIRPFGEHGGTRSRWALGEENDLRPAFRDELRARTPPDLHMVLEC